MKISRQDVWTAFRALSFQDGPKPTYDQTGRPAFQSSIKNVKLLVMRSLKLSRERVYTVFYAESEFHSLKGYFGLL